MKEGIRSSLEWMNRGIRSLYWSVLNLGYRARLLSPYRIPVIINNFNRLGYLRELIHSLEACGLTRIIIIDNCSTYPPLLEFYERCNHRVIRLRENYGHLSLWKSGLYHRYKWNYFIYTDPDLIPIAECPKDFIVYFKQLLDRHHELDKIGFGLRIDDLPDTFSLKEKVIAYEKKYWQKKAGDGVYDAPIDTTFALYKPLSGLKRGEVYTLKAWRSDFPYLASHLPWYVDSGQPSAEDQYYMQTCNASSSMGKQKTSSAVY
jgi:glycosyltransferase involved in cell wall biosynthesis